MNLFLFLLALITIFIAGGLYFKSRGLKNVTIALFTLLFGLEILYFVSGTTDIVAVFPFIRGRFYFSIGFLYGPILLFHFQSIVNGRQKLTPKDYIHFVPLLVLNIYMMDIVIMDSAERFAYFRNADNFFNRILYLNYARSIHQIIYAIIILLLYNSNKSQLNTDKKFYLAAFSIIYVITTVFISLLTVFANGWRDFKWYYTLSTLLVLVIGYILYREPKFFLAIKAKYHNSGMSESDLKDIQSRVQRLFLKEHTYLDNNLTIATLASQLNLKKHHVSQMFTSVQKENFNDYVNKHRIQHAKVLLLDANHSQYKIEAIAQESGFNNKVTFYKAFSKFVGTTPSAFRKTASNK